MVVEVPLDQVNKQVELEYLVKEEMEEALHLRLPLRLVAVEDLEEVVVALIVLGNQDQL